MPQIFGSMEEPFSYIYKAIT